VKPSAADEADLRLYFDLGVDHFSPPSNFGAQLELADRFWGELVPCQACGGVDAVVSDDGETYTPERAGSGFVTNGRAWKQRLMVAKIVGVELPPPDDLVCKPCAGRCWVRRRARRRKPTVQRTGQSPQSPADPTALLERLERFGRVDRVLYRLRPADPTAYEVLSIYYAPDGSLAALWCLTEAGRQMLEGRENDLTEAAYFRILRERQAKSHNPVRAAQFAAAEKQSQELLEEAWQQWGKWAQWRRAG